MRRLTHNPVLLSCIALSVALCGCQKKATGQVAAVVNGDEITLQEVNAELAAANIPDGAQKDQARSVVVQRLIDRRLLEQQAKASGVDRDPEFLTRQRQLNQTLLLQFYAKRAQDTLRVPDASAIQAYTASHPASFVNRTVYAVDQIRFATPADPKILAGMSNLHSLDVIAQYLQEQGIAFDRANSKIDSAQVPPQMLQRVLALPPGEPFIVPTPQAVVASVITSREAMPLAPDQAQPLAVQMIRSQELDKILQQRVKEARDKAKIAYQPGFAPNASTK